MVFNEIQARARGQKGTAQKLKSTTQAPCKTWERLHAVSVAEAIWNKRGQVQRQSTRRVGDTTPSVWLFRVRHPNGQTSDAACTFAAQW